MNLPKVDTSGHHGSPADRGAADSYYGRPAIPHWWPQGTSHGTRIEAADMTPAQIADYHAAFEANERDRNFKDWG